MIRSDRRLRLCRVLLVLTLAFIWGNSLMPAELSHSFSQWVKELLARFLSGDTPITEEGSGLLRKIAHFTEFTALGIVLAWRGGMLGKNPCKTFLAGVTAAAVDETIQCFVPGRGPGIADVLLDSSGVLTGMLLCFLGHTLLKRETHHSINILEDTK